MKSKRYIIFLLTMFLCGNFTVFAQETSHEQSDKLDVNALILEHVGDAYEWHITAFGHTPVSIPLPVIVKGQASGWHVFSSSKFHHGHDSYLGFSIAEEGEYKGKIVETLSNGTQIRPWDFSLTKNAVALLMSVVILIVVILSCASWYKKRIGKPEKSSPKGFIAFMEMTIMSIVDDVIKPCIGKNYKRYTPYLLTVFFFIIVNNFIGLIPIFPGGANVTGNIAITFTLAMFTFVIVNIFGTKEYWREIFWPDVPVWLKIPPIIPIIELIGIFTKPFALMVRLFANILAGHSIVLGLVSIVFLTVAMGALGNGLMSGFSVIMTVFINFIELLVAYVQAYVFTMLSAVFIGLSQVEPHHR